MRQRNLLALAVAILLAMPATAVDLVPIRHSVLTDERGNTIAELLTADRFESAESPGAVFALLETADGTRSLVFHSLDTEAGVTSERLDDLSSGWGVELTVDYGYAGMGSADEFADSWAWVAAQEERREMLRTPTTYQLTTTDGISETWEEPYRNEKAATEARTDALARFATRLIERRPPASSFALVRAHESFVESDTLGETDVAKKLIRMLVRTFRSIEPEWATEGRTVVKGVKPDEQTQRLAKMLERTVGDG